MNEVPAQIAEIRDARIGSVDSPGHVHFRLGALFAENNRLAMVLSDTYRERAIVPAYPWLGPAVPAAPKVSYIAANGPSSFTVAPGDSVRVRWWLVQTRGANGIWTTSLRPAGEGDLAAGVFGEIEPDEIAITALSSTGVASQPTIITP